MRQTCLWRLQEAEAAAIQPPVWSRSVAQSGSAHRSGRWGRRFKSCHSDQSNQELRVPRNRSTQFLRSDWSSDGLIGGDFLGGLPARPRTSRWYRTAREPDPRPLRAGANLNRRDSHDRFRDPSARRYLNDLSRRASYGRIGWPPKTRVASEPAATAFSRQSGKA